MPVSKKHMEYANNYIKENYEQIVLRIKKGERDRYKRLAAKLGVSVNQLFVQAVEQYISDHIDDLAEPPALTPNLGEPPTHKPE